MPHPLSVLPRTVSCGKDLAEEGEIVEDLISSVSSTPKPSKEKDAAVSAVVGKGPSLQTASSFDRKFTRSLEMSSRHRDLKRPRASEYERSSHASKNHRDSYRESLSRRSVREIELSKLSNGHSRHESRSKVHAKESRKPSKDNILKRPSQDASKSKPEPHKPIPNPTLKENRAAPKIDAEEAVEVEYDLEDPEVKENRLIEERRKKRQAILEKHKHLRAEAAAPSPAASFTSDPDNFHSNNSPIDFKKYPGKPFTAAKSRSHSPSGLVSPDNELAAADYNPNAKRSSNSKFFCEGNDESDFFKAHPSAICSVVPCASSSKLADDAKACAPADIEEFDMFGDEVPLPRLTGEVPVIAHNPALQDNWDDSEGYYRITLGEVLNDRYHVFSVLGKGVFSSVVKAKDLSDSEKVVAIKIIRCNETMHRLGLKEVDILKKLRDTDPKNKRHVVRFENHFVYRGHLCMVFESLSMNLREVLKKYGKDVGIAIKAVRVYAQQLFLALSLLKKCDVIHADVKPDNILVSDSHNTLKLCDLGSASYSSDNEITPYLVSRFYRAPEIILGLPYDSAIDVWSAGCTLYEIYTGKILFPGRNNNHMLKLMIDLKGRFPNRMVKRGSFASQHFDENFNFLYQDNGTTKKINVAKQPLKEFKQRIMSVSSNATEDELRLTHLLVDFLDRCLQPNPEHRMSVHEALEHPFLH
ncbi:U4/U6 small nuclear ribonucleoprotein prp4 [Massospora cicadina]|nr:U4/U6 small nuclear ribonucleoprotein prp4 [Massospora cicadina]